MEVFEAKVVATLLKIPPECFRCLTNLGVLSVVFGGVGENEENVFKEVVDGFVVAALYATLHCSQVHWVQNHIKVVTILKKKIQSQGLTEN